MSLNLSRRQGLRRHRAFEYRKICGEGKDERFGVIDFAVGADVTPPFRAGRCPHRGISQVKLPIYLGFFQFVHNVRKRGKRLLGALVGALVA